jgi:phosphonoacetaldehyde hydrolase
MIEAVILDWAGTTVDHGCLAPVVVLEEIFADKGVPLERSEARHAMGLLKVDQIREICRLPRVADAWATRFGAEPNEADVQELFIGFVPSQLRVIEEHSGLIEGVLEFVAECARRGIPIGTTTGYTRPMLDLVLGRAAKEGYLPAATVTPEEAGGGRPSPWMVYRCTQLLGVYPLSRCVKIGDTLSDIAEGQNAGMVTVALTSCGNEVGLSAADFAALSEGERAAKTQQAELTLSKGEPDFLASNLAACVPLLDRVEEMLAARANR